MGSDGGCTGSSEIYLGNYFYQLVSSAPLVAFKILTLLKIVEFEGSPTVKITLRDGTISEGYFNGILSERGSFKLAISIENKGIVKIDPLSVKELFVIDQDSDHITEESILDKRKLDLEIKEYFKAQSVVVGGGGVGWN